LKKKAELERIKTLRTDLHRCLAVFALNNKWKKYLECAMLVHDFNALIEKMEKKK
jgi:hypothetical protein